MHNPPTHTKSKNLNKQKKKMFELFIVQPMNIDSTWHGWMNLCVTTTSIQVDTIFLSTSDEDQTPPLPPSCCQQKKNPPKKSLSPSLSNLKFGRFLFSVDLFLGSRMNCQFWFLKLSKDRFPFNFNLFKEIGIRFQFQSRF